MKKSEICMNNATIAYYSGLNGLEIKYVDYTPDGDYVYCVSGAWGGAKSYHRCKVYYPASWAAPFFRVHGYRVSVADCVRVDI